MTLQNGLDMKYHFAEDIAETLTAQLAITI